MDTRVAKHRQLKEVFPAPIIMLMMVYRLTAEGLWPIFYLWHIDSSIIAFIIHAVMWCCSTSREMSSNTEIRSQLFVIRRRVKFHPTPMTLKALSLNFRILSIAGVWLPPSCSSYWKSILFHSYTFFVTGILHSLLSFQCIGLFDSTESIPDFLASISTLGTIYNMCWKFFNILTKRTEITQLFQLFESEICQPKTIEEEAIEKKSTERIW